MSSFNLHQSNWKEVSAIVSALSRQKRNDVKECIPLSRRKKHKKRPSNKTHSNENIHNNNAYLFKREVMVKCAVAFHDYSQRSKPTPTKTSSSNYSRSNSSRISTPTRNVQLKSTSSPSSQNFYADRYVLSSDFLQIWKKVQRLLNYPIALKDASNEVYTQFLKNHGLLGKQVLLSFRQYMFICSHLMNEVDWARFSFFSSNKKFIDNNRKCEDKGFLTETKNIGETNKKHPTLLGSKNDEKHPYKHETKDCDIQLLLPLQGIWSLNTPLDDSAFRDNFPLHHTFLPTSIRPKTSPLRNISGNESSSPRQSHRDMWTEKKNVESRDRIQASKASPFAILQSKDVAASLASCNIEINQRSQNRTKSNTDSSIKQSEIPKLIKEQYRVYKEKKKDQTDSSQKNDLSNSSSNVSEAPHFAQNLQSSYCEDLVKVIQKSSSDRQTRNEIEGHTPSISKLSVPRTNLEQKRSIILSKSIETQNQKRKQQHYKSMSNTLGGAIGSIAIRQLEEFNDHQKDEWMQEMQNKVKERKSHRLRLRNVHSETMAQKYAERQQKATEMRDRLDFAIQKLQIKEENRLKKIQLQKQSLPWPISTRFKRMKQTLSSNALCPEGNKYNHHLQNADNLSSNSDIYQYLLSFSLPCAYEELEEGGKGTDVVSCNTSNSLKAS